MLYGHGKEAVREKSYYILSDLVNIKVFWKIPDDEGGLFQNAWFQGVLYFERLRALILLKRGDAQISM